MVGRSRGGGTNTTTMNNRQWRIETQAQGQHELYSRLILDRADANNNGLYECEASSAPASAGIAGGGEIGMQQQQQKPMISREQPADRLRRLFGVLVNGK